MTILKFLALLLLVGPFIYIQIGGVDGTEEGGSCSNDGQSGCKLTNEIVCNAKVSEPLCPDKICDTIQKCVPKDSNGTPTYCPEFKCVITSTKEGFNSIACRELFEALYSYFKCYHDFDLCNCEIDDYNCCTRKIDLMNKIDTYVRYLALHGDPQPCSDSIHKAIEKVKTDAIDNCCWNQTRCATPPECKCPDDQHDT